MNMKFAAATALASSLLVLPLMQGSAQSASMRSKPGLLAGALEPLPTLTVDSCAPRLSLWLESQ